MRMWRTVLFEHEVSNAFFTDVRVRVTTTRLQRAGILSTAQPTSKLRKR